MPKFAANLTTLFNELPMLQRFAAAKRAGFSGVEVLFPYDLAAKELSRAARIEGLDFVLLNAPPPNWTGGPRGFAADPAGAERFRRDFDRALRFAEALNARHIHIMAGIAEGEAARATLVANLQWASQHAPGASLTIKPQSPAAMPGYFLDSFDLAAAIIAEAARPNLGLQFDTRQAREITGDIASCWQRHRALVRHVQIGDTPIGGAADPAGFLSLIAADGYDGWISAAYAPAGRTEAGLDWLPRA